MCSVTNLTRSRGRSGDGAVELGELSIQPDEAETLARMAGLRLFPW